MIPCTLATSYVKEHLSIGILTLVAEKVGFLSSLQIILKWFWRINKKILKQSSLFLFTVSSKILICFRRGTVCVIMSWVRISTALSSNKRSNIIIGSNSSSKKSSWSLRHDIDWQLRLWTNKGVTKVRVKNVNFF